MISTLKYAPFGTFICPCTQGAWLERMTIYANDNAWGMTFLLDPKQEEEELEEEEFNTGDACLETLDASEDTSHADEANEVVAAVLTAVVPAPSSTGNTNQSLGAPPSAVAQPESTTKPANELTSDEKLAQLLVGISALNGKVDMLTQQKTQQDQAVATLTNEVAQLKHELKGVSKSSKQVATSLKSVPKIAKTVEYVRKHTRKLRPM
jgi:hypothetical protein